MPIMQKVVDNVKILMLETLTLSIGGTIVMVVGSCGSRNRTRTLLENRHLASVCPGLGRL